MQDDLDVIASAETAAQRFEGDGWVVERLIVETASGSTRYVVFAERDDERVEISFFEPTGVSILALAGPCVPRVGPPVIQNATPVGQFP